MLMFACASAAASLHGRRAGTWPFGVVEGIWSVVAVRHWLERRAA
jgi:hypothetical protein